MLETVRRMRRDSRSAIIGLIVLVSACHPTRGCAEARFSLATESRLPRLLTLPTGVRREDVECVLTYYPAPLKGKERLAVLALRTKAGRELEEIQATLRGSEPVVFAPLSVGENRDYPSYEVLTADGVSDVIVHRRLEPIFYVSDDPEIRSRFGLRP